MRYQVRYDLGQPVYLQLMDQIKAAAASGVLRAGDALPGIRPLAEELRINRNTVAKAYVELEREGVVETRPGKGCFVRNGGTRLNAAARTEMLEPLIDAVIVQAHHLRVGDEQVVKLVRSRMERFRVERESTENAKEA